MLVSLSNHATMGKTPRKILSKVRPVGVINKCKGITNSLPFYESGLFGLFWLMVSVCPSSYGYTREVGKHEGSVRVARGDSRLRLWFLEC